MSRTGAHTPFAVRISRGELGAHEEHDHRIGVCDLPPRRRCARSSLRATRCRWEWTYTGGAICSCSMCHAGQWHRRENRDRRHHDRIAIAHALSAWNGGEPTSFDEVVPPHRRSCF
jgi:hypothetical protein